MGLDIDLGEIEKLLDSIRKQSEKFPKFIDFRSYAMMVRRPDFADGLRSP